MERSKQVLDVLIRVGVLVALSVGVWFMVSMQQRFVEVDKLLSKSNDTMLQVARTAQTIQATTKSFQEQLDDTQTIQARKNAQLALTAATQHLAFITLPTVDETVKKVGADSSVLVKSVMPITDELSSRTLPALTQTILTTELETKETTAKLRSIADKIAAAYVADSHEVFTELSRLLTSGRISVENLDKAANLTEDKLNIVLDNTGQITHNLAETTAELAPMARHARKWQPVLTGTRLIALLLSIFN